MVSRQTPVKGGRGGANNDSQLIKSPSDTTIYAPALRQMGQQVTGSVVNNDEIIEKISNFVEEIRFENATGRTPPWQRDQRDRQESNDEPPPDDQKPGVQVPRGGETLKERESEKFVIEAKQFWASVEPPVPGNTHNELIRKNEPMRNNVMVQVMQPVDSDNDDDFFHLACHMDAALKVKIERGEFVDLDRLLRKRRNQGKSHLEWITKDGMTFLSPAQDHKNCVSNIKKWDQAFLVYVAIYCQANPGCAGEIW